MAIEPTTPSISPEKWADRPPEARLGVVLVRVATLVAAVVCVVLDYGFPDAPRSSPLGGYLSSQWLGALQVALVALYGLDVWLGVWRGRLALHDQKPDWIDLFLILLAGSGVITHLVTLDSVGTAAQSADEATWGWHLFETSFMLLLLAELWRLNAVLSRRFHRPGALLPASFLIMIAVGTGLLKLPPAVPPGQDISWLDALFTMTSAVCVTGLVVRDTATGFTPFGQAVIGVFIQLGGLGIIIFGSMLAMLLGARLSLRENLSLSSMLQDMPLKRINNFVRFIVMLTLGCELIGAVAMMGMWPGDIPLVRRVGLSLFHSVSAFCNAGFALQSDSLESYRYAPLAHLVVLPLLVVGGLGFPVLGNLWQALLWRVRPKRALRSSPFNMFRPDSHYHDPDTPDLSRRRLNLHTKIVLVTTASLYLYGLVGLAAGQLKPYLNEALQQGFTANRAELPPLSPGRIGAVLADASFMSLTARTAGFNTVPMDEVSPAGRFVLMTLMMVGASPGGTGGGMKTTTIALLLLSIVATIRGRTATEGFNRSVDDALIRKAATLAASFIALVSLATLLLSFSEPYPFGKIAFEAVSAASTTGLSLGITADLTPFGKTVIILTMFAGRVGPLALLAGLMFGGGRRQLYRYPHESVVIG